MILVKDNAGQDAMIDNGWERERTLLHDMRHLIGDEIWSKLLTQK